jgi:predicted ATPase
VIKSIKAEGYKSIKKLELELGRINVFIGENGAGKSNILEVFALAGAAVARKLDNEFLSSRGIRVTEPEYMRPAFVDMDCHSSISMHVMGDGDESFSIRLNNDNLPYSKWSAAITDFLSGAAINSIIDAISMDIKVIDVPEHNKNMLDGVPDERRMELETLSEIKELLSKLRVIAGNDKVTVQSGSEPDSNDRFFSFWLHDDLGRFIIYSPENSALRVFQHEGQIEPLGIKGEGLLKLLSVLSREEHGETLHEIKSSLKLLGWFEDFALVDGDTISPRRITIKDRYVEENKRYFDQMSANEGFLFLLFYFALFSTHLTPKIFAIDNIDASLNPKLCEKLLRELTRLAKKHDKQVLLTTHNPATLDGLNLDDDEQRLFVVSRGQSGETRVKRLQKKLRSSDKDKPLRLSEMFLKGSLGGLPKGF